MSILGRLFLLFVGVPLLELLILIKMGQFVGFWPTIGLVVLTGLAGGALARLEGLRTIWKIRGELARGHLPGDSLLDGLSVLLGGALLLTPGILTDLVGFSFLFPPTRKLLKGRMRRSLERRLKAGSIRITHAAAVRGYQGSFWGWAGDDRAETSDPAREIVIEDRRDTNA